MRCMFRKQKIVIKTIIFVLGTGRYNAIIHINEIDKTPFQQRNIYKWHRWELGLDSLQILSPQGGGMDALFCPNFPTVVLA